MASNIRANFGFAANIMVKPNYGTAPGGTIPIYRFRANNFGLQVKQEITFPPLIDGMVDRSAYQLAAQLVDGDVGFPLVHEGSALGQVGDDSTLCGNATDTSLVQELWKFAAERDVDGRMANSLDIAAVYPDSTAFLYPKCYVNTATFSVTEQGPVDVKFNVIGGSEGVGRKALTSTDGFQADTGTAYPAFLSPARIVTWNDFVIAFWQMDETAYTFTKVLDGEGLRQFDCTINNNIDRFYTFNGKLAPQDVAAKKRMINGNIKILGRNEWLNNFAIGDNVNPGTSGNESRFTSHEYISFGYRLGAAGGIYWATALHGVVFKPEEMSLSPDAIFETTVGYEAAGDCKMDYEATRLGTNLSETSVVTELIEPDGTNYGQKTRVPTASTFKQAYPSYPNGFNGWEYVP